MSRVVFRPEVRRKLPEIYQYSLDRHGAAQAERYLAGFRQKCTQYARMPGMGKATTPGSPVRQALYGKHRIFYREIQGGIEVGRVFHQSQDFTRELSAYERQASRLRQVDPQPPNRSYEPGGE